MERVGLVSDRYVASIRLKCCGYNGNIAYRNGQFTLLLIIDLSR